MSIDIKTKDSPGWWLMRLSKKLQDRQADVSELFQRYEGDAPVPSSLDQAPEAAQRFFKASRTAFAEMVVKAVKYPLRLQSVTTSADQSESGDQRAWRLVVSSGMQVESDDVHRITLTAGDGYAIVGMYDGVARYTAEDPRQVVTIHDPVVQALVRAGGKFFHDDEAERDRAYLYRPGRVWRSSFPRATTGSDTPISFSENWTWDEDYGGEDGLALPAGCEDLVTVLRYRNEEGVGEFARHRDLLDRLDHMVLQGMTIATLQAFKQRAIIVSQKAMPDEDPDTGEKIDYNDVLAADPGALWKLPETAEIWESGNVDLTPVWTGMEKFTQQLSAVTFTPLGMFTPDGQNQSAAGAAFAREGRTFKIEDRQDRFGATHALALSALLRISGDADRSAAEDIVVNWRPAERYGLAEKADAATKAKAADVPWATRMRDIWQYTPQQIASMRSERMDDALLFPAQVGAVPQEPAIAEPAL